MYVEWSTNEKIGFEVALGASISGVRAITVTKNVGVNWIVEPLATATMYGTPGLVIVFADDPGAETTSNEQDTRYIAMFTDSILLEASTMQEIKDFTVTAFELSEQSHLPVMLRVMERMGWGRGPVSLGKIQHKIRNKKAKFDKYSDYWASRTAFPWPINAMSAKHMRFHGEGPKELERLVGSMPKAAETMKLVESFPHNKLTLSERSRVGLITSGVCYSICMEALKVLRWPEEVAVLKLATTYPPPKKLISRLLVNTETVLVVEEIEPFIENQVRSISADLENHATIRGKLTGDIPFSREMERNVVGSILAKLLGKDFNPKACSKERVDKVKKELLQREELWGLEFTFCPGCPEQAALYALKAVCREMAVDFIAYGDNGCHENSHEDIALITMGSGASYAQGMFHAGVQDKMIAVVGDSCFFHAVMPALANAVYNKANFLLYVMDNRTTGMTGMQPHPGAQGVTAMGEPTEVLDIAEVARALRVGFVDVVDPYNQEETRAALKRAIEFNGTSVVVARRPCAILALRK